MSPLPSFRLAAFVRFLTFRFTFLTLAFRLALRFALDLGRYRAVNLILIMISVCCEDSVVRGCEWAGVRTVFEEENT